MVCKLVAVLMSLALLVNTEAQSQVRQNKRLLGGLLGGGGGGGGGGASADVSAGANANASAGLTAGGGLSGLGGLGGLGSLLSILSILGGLGRRDADMASTEGEVLRIRESEHNMETRLVACILGQTPVVCTVLCILRGYNVGVCNNVNDCVCRNT